MQLNFDRDRGALFLTDSNVHSQSNYATGICTRHHNTHANYILIIKHSNKQTNGEEIPHNHQVLIEQVLTWCAWPDSLPLDQSVIMFGRGAQSHFSVIAWHCNSWGRGSTVLWQPSKLSTKPGTNPD